MGSLGLPALPAFWEPKHTIALQYIARQAGEAIIEKSAEALSNVLSKPDGTPVTLADHASQDVILEGLSKLTPDIPIISEEKDNPAVSASGGTFWLVDPLDGTREFSEGGSEYSVNIGLMVNFTPCLGVIYAPVFEELYYGDVTGVLHFKAGEQFFIDPARLKTEGPPRLLSSRMEAKSLPIDTWLKDGRISDCRLCSSALKFGLLAKGDADFYIRPGSTCEWDTAAGDVLLRALGGRIVTADGAALTYGKLGFKNNGFIAYGPTFSREGVEGFLGAV